MRKRRSRGPFFSAACLVDVQDAQVRLVADGVDHDLQADLVGGLDALEHDAFGQHLVEEQAARVRGVAVRLEEERGGRAKAAVGETLEPADAQHVAAERGAHAGLGQRFPRDNGADGVDAGLQFAALEHVLVKADVFAGGHVRDAGNAHLRGVFGGCARGDVLFLEALFRHGAVHEFLGGVLEDAGRLAGLGVAHDDAARRVLGFLGNACELEGEAVGQGHVAVEAVDPDGVVGRGGVNHLPGRQRRAGPASRGPNRRPESSGLWGACGRNRSASWPAPVGTGRRAGPRWRGRSRP